VKGGKERNAYFKKPLRRVIVKRPDKTTPIILVTNDFEKTAEDIAALYKKRWDIELFFKWIKQNLKLKTFLGRNENSVKTQIYTAIISYLLLKIYQQKQGTKISLKLCLTVLRTGLFQRDETEQKISKKELTRRKKIRDLQRELVF